MGAHKDRTRLPRTPLGAYPSLLGALKWPTEKWRKTKAVTHVTPTAILYVSRVRERLKCAVPSHVSQEALSGLKQILRLFRRRCRLCRLLE
jgi:hypothetical protein